MRRLDSAGKAQHEFHYYFPEFPRELQVLL